MSDHDTFITNLTTVLTLNVNDFLALEDCQQLSAGASQETYRIRYRHDGGEKSLALRRTQPTAGGSTVGGISLDTEATLLTLACANDIPAPEVVYVLQDTDGLGQGFLMQWLDGETLGQRIVAAEELAPTRSSLARSCGEILGRIHALDWQSAGLQHSLPTVDPAQLVEETYNAYRALEVPVPVIDYTWRWLRENLPTDSRCTLVHGDFRNGNLMVTPKGINAVLDWELAHIGDPLRDLGWLCVNSWRFGKSDLAVGGFGTVDDLLEGYRTTSGINVTPGALKFWQLFGSFWWSMVTLQMANSWRTGETPSLERPVIGRRSSEAQMDCVNLLFPGEFELPSEPHVPEQGTQLPMPEELISGVASFLKHEAAPQLDAHNQFLARVAANSLRIAQREFQFGGAAADAEQRRLVALLATEAPLDTLRQLLADSLRNDMALDAPGLQAHLRQTVATQLFIDQPRYSALHFQP